MAAAPNVVTTTQSLRSLMRQVQQGRSMKRKPKRSLTRWLQRKKEG